MKKYNMSDAVMFQRSRTIRQHLIDNLPDFQVLDPDFNAVFIADWLAAIEDSENWENAETRLDRQGQETAEVLEAMQNARQHYILVKYFVLKAYANKPKVLEKFGLDDYDDAAYNQALMVPFLANLHKQCTDPAHSADLSAVNLTAAHVGNLLNLKNILSTEDTQQNVFIANTQLATQDREKQHNATFSFWQKTNAASKVVYINDPVKLNLFLYPRRNETALSIEGTVTNTSGGGLLQGVAVSVQGQSITVLTDENGDYGIAGLAAGSYTLVFTLAGFIEQTIPVTIGLSSSNVVNVALQPA